MEMPAGRFARVAATARNGAERTARFVRGRLARDTSLKDRGAEALEWVGVLLVAAAIVAALLAVKWDGVVNATVGKACTSMGLQGCPGGGEQPQQQPKPQP